MRLILVPAGETKRVDKQLGESCREIANECIRSSEYAIAVPWKASSGDMWSKLFRQFLLESLVPHAVPARWLLQSVVSQVKTNRDFRIRAVLPLAASSKTA